MITMFKITYRQGREMSRFIPWYFSLLALWLPACRTEVTDLDGALRAELSAAEVGPVLAPRTDPDLARLGEKLFFDKLLSGDKDISCSGCHHPTLAAGDGIPFSIGTGGDGLGP